MKVNSVSVSYQRKFRLAEYESLGLECTIWADLEEGDSAPLIITALQEQARVAVKNEFERLPKNGKRTQ